VNFLRGVGQTVRVNVDPDPAAKTLQVLAQVQLRNILFKIVTTVRALEFDHVSIDIRHREILLPPVDISLAGVWSGKAACSPTRNDRGGTAYGTASRVSRALSRQASATDTSYRSAGQIDLFCWRQDRTACRPPRLLWNTAGDNANTYSNCHKNLRLRAGNGAF
jgi:hypothetical protein